MLWRVFKHEKSAYGSGKMIPWNVVKIGKDVVSSDVKKRPSLLKSPEQSKADLNNGSAHAFTNLTLRSGTESVNRFHITQFVAYIHQLIKRRI
jgi:hypothetical protein